MGFLLWPFKMIWSLISFLFKLMGRLAAIIVGTLLLIAGIILTFTVIGAFVGIPLVILGFMLVLRAVF